MNEATTTMTDEREELTEAQLKALPIMSIIAGSLSVIGSSCLVYMILSQRRKRLNQTYHRTMLVVSCADIWWSFWVGLGAIPVPTTTGAYLAFGNEASCTTQGFMLQLGTPVLFYNAFLMLYFLLIIRFSVSERKLAPYERWGHALIWTYTLGSSVFFLVMDAYNPVGIGPTRCYISSFPIGCDDLEELECERGHHAGKYLLWLVVVPAGFAFAIMWLCNLLIIWTVWCQSRRSKGIQRYNNRTKENTLMVLVQSCLYGMAYLNTFIYTYFLFVVATVADKQNWSASRIYPVELLAELFFPLQGFFNFLIYIRPRYLRIRKLCKSESFCYQLRETFGGTTPLAEIGRRRSMAKMRLRSDGKRITNNNSSTAIAGKTKDMMEARHFDNSDDDDGLSPSQILMSGDGNSGSGGPQDDDDDKNEEGSPHLGFTQGRASIHLQELEEAARGVDDNDKPTKKTTMEHDSNHPSPRMTLPQDSECSFNDLPRAACEARVEEKTMNTTTTRIISR